MASEDYRSESTDPIDWNVTNSANVPGSANILPAPPAPSPKNTVLRKDGGFAGEGSNLIYWTVRVNWAQKQINNAKVTDTVGSDQSLDPERGIVVFSCTVDGDTVKQGPEVKPKSVTYLNDREFVVDLGDIKGPYNIFYFTKFDTKAAQGTKFTNAAVLTGDDIDKVEVKTETSAYSGDGGANDPGGNPVNPSPSPKPNPEPKPTPVNPSPKPGPAPQPEPVDPSPAPRPVPKDQSGKKNKDLPDTAGDQKNKTASWQKTSVLPETNKVNAKQTLLALATTFAVIASFFGYIQTKK
ncbi:hypothetical protein LQZ24_02185 [Fructobacillus sp. M1-13]|uniref:Collagen binding domain-containing protein n=1 Tax=Fructobacillus papyriferae TaxID=2713171 RepID=A0ABS5QPU9_9LACO|nr:collagen binding domain-containing protein [Fructobacillus papyriferae]MBS9334847.1 hypothetical protein [Fructobacillus papyriferae]MCD2158837.1 hypothetical protein [Fructobacillus papyriferae]